MSAPFNLRCEYRENPLGLDEIVPRLSWLLSHEGRGVRQTAYRILVTAGEEIWDSGKVLSHHTSQIPYQGRPLLSRQRCTWKVMVWDQEDQPSPWSEPAWWEMGLLNRDDWKASWIGLEGTRRPDGRLPATYLRKTFTVNNLSENARIYASALGLYTLLINDQPVGPDLFTPGWTDYRKRIQYQTYDISPHLRTGDNTLEAVLGDGWYCGHIGLAQRNWYGELPHLLVQLEADGRIVVTDGSWEASTGPIQSADILMGEICDARQRAAYDRAPRVMPLGEALLTAQPCQAVRRQVELVPVSVTEPSPGVFVFDVGQNIAGWARLQVKGKAGDTVRLRFAEVLNADGTIYTANLRLAECTDVYTLKGGDKEIYEPRFTYHGFRYVEVTGFPGKPGRGAVTGVVLHTAAPPSGRFECSNGLVNKLHENITWGQRGNFFEVPTDCPQRDERLGWTGDAQVFLRTAAFNMDVAAFFTKWLIDLKDAQLDDGSYPHVAPNVLAGSGTAGWADAGVICPWMLYLCYGDLRILERHYPAMQRWIEYLKKHSRRLIRPDEGFGDWVSIKADTPKDMIATAYFAHSTHLVEQIARLLGKEEEAEGYAALFEKIRAAFNREFVTPGSRVAGNTQTGYVLALAFDLLPERKRAAAVKRLVRDIEARGFHPSTGFLGVSKLLPVLTRFGRTDVAYRLLLNEDYPSWGYTIRHGATTIWERWDGWRADKGYQDPEMNSFNHYAFGSMGEWLYRTVAGIDLAEPGYRRIVIRPIPGGGLTHAEGVYDSIHGRIISRWESRDDRFELVCKIPPNVNAIIHLPTKSTQGVTEGGIPLDQAEGIHRIEAVGGEVTVETGSGEFRFHISR